MVGNLIKICQTNNIKLQNYTENFYQLYLEKELLFFPHFGEEVEYTSNG